MMTELESVILSAWRCLPVERYIYLYDAVYLYLRTVNHTLAEGNSDYRDGHLIRNKTIGQRFTGKHSETVLGRNSF